MMINPGRIGKLKFTFAWEIHINRALRILALCFREMVLATRSVLISLEYQLLVALRGDDVDPLSLCDWNPDFGSKTGLLADLALSIQAPLDSQLTDMFWTGNQDPERIACRIGYIMNELRCSSFDHNFNREFDRRLPPGLDRLAQVCELLRAVGQWQWQWAERSPIATSDYLRLSQNLRVEISGLLSDNPYMKTLAIPEEMRVNPIFLPKMPPFMTFLEALSLFIIYFRTI